jgi:anthranilate phosphoribosyltransferase
LLAKKLLLAHLQKGRCNMIDTKHFVKEHAARNIPLGYDEAYELGLYLMEACRGDSLAQIQSVALLTALHNQATYAWDGNGHRFGHALPQSAAEQIAGICAAIFEHDIAKSQSGFLSPNVPYAMDNCGMGGDLIITANISTIAAFTAAVAGIPMCKHGSPANADRGRHGSSDFIDMCGINRLFPREAVEKCVETLSFGYTEALDTAYKHIHVQTHNIAKLPHMNDIIGPITNPLSPKILTRRILGVNHLIKPEIVAEAYKVLNQRGVTHLNQGLFIRGFIGDRHEGGVDELSISEPGTQVAELKDGKISEYWLTAEDFGVEPIAPEFVSPPAGMSKGEFSMAILKGEAPEPSIRMAIANTALLFYLAGRSNDLKQCYLMAKEILESRKVLERISRVREILPAR